MEHIPALLRLCGRLANLAETLAYCPEEWTTEQRANAANTAEEARELIAKTATACKITL